MLSQTGATARPSTALLRAIFALVLLAAWLALDAAAVTRGAVLEQGPSTTLVINEVDYIQPAPVDEAEFVELKHVGTAPVDLGGYALLRVNAGGQVEDRIILPPDELLPDAYYVVCDTAEVPNCDFVLDREEVWLDGVQAPAAVALVAVDPQAPGDPGRDVLVDSVSYGGSVDGGPPTGGTWTEGEGVTAGDHDRTPRLGLSRWQDGADGIDNDENKRDFSTRCITPGYPNSMERGVLAPCPPPDELGAGGLVINELDLVQPGGDVAEFVELKNEGTETIDLRGHVLLSMVLDASGAVTEHARVELPPDKIAPGGYYVVCGDLATVPRCDVAGAPPVDAWPDPISKPDLLGFAVALVDTTAGESQAFAVDSVAYDGDVPGGPPGGGSWTEEASVLPGDDNDVDFRGLSRWPDGVDTDVNSDDLGRHCITPGEVNDSATDPTSCPEPAQPTPTETVPTATTTATTPPRETPTPTATETAAATSTPAGPDVLTLTVNSADDAADPDWSSCLVGQGECTLRGALQALDAADHEGPIHVTFRRAMTITITAGALPDITRDDVTVDGRVAEGTAVRAESAPHAAPGQTGAPDQLGDPAVTLLGPGDGAFDGLTLDGVQNVRVQGLALRRFRTAIVVKNGPDGAATGNIIGSDGDGVDDVREGNLLADNLMNGLGLRVNVSGNEVRGNQIRGNYWHGIAVDRIVPGNWLQANHITANGGEAIAARQLTRRSPQPPLIDPDLLVDRVIGGQACPGCWVEVFVDPSDEAATFLAGTWADENVGLWEFQSVPSGPSLGNLTATATMHDEDGRHTSTLSSAVPLAPRCVLREIPPSSPRAVTGEGLLERVYQLTTDASPPEPIAGAEIRWSPIEQASRSDSQGRVVLQVPLRALRNLNQLGTGLSIEVVAPGGDTPLCALAWSPRLAVAFLQRDARIGQPLLDLSGLAPSGVGAQLLRSSSGPLADLRAAFGDWLTAGWALRTSGQSQRLSSAPHQETEAYGAAWTAAPVSELRTGQYAWQEAIARGGGIYELMAGGETLSGQLEITAPAEAYNQDGPASACGGDEGSVIAGWKDDGTCWVPVPGASVNAPVGDAPTFSASTAVSLGATDAYTLYTVGYDTEPPVVAPAITDGAVLSVLPAVLGQASDALSGVESAAGVVVRLDGDPLPAGYDPQTMEIRLPETARAVSGPPRSAQLVFEVTDGYCNMTRTTITVQIDPDVPPTATATLTSTPTITATPQNTATPTDIVPPTAVPETVRIYLPVAAREVD